VIGVGERVRALHPNASWGEGTVVEVRDVLPAFKPLVVQRDDGTVGYFYRDQVEAKSNT
jgi:hypothetical protein